MATCLTWLWGRLPSMFGPLLLLYGCSCPPRTSRSGLGRPVVLSSDSARTPGCGTGPRDPWALVSPQCDQRWSLDRACRSHCDSPCVWGCSLPSRLQSAHRVPRASRPPISHAWQCGQGRVDAGGIPADLAGLVSAAPALSRVSELWYASFDKRAYDPPCL